jgi:hypothetical protein
MNHAPVPDPEDRIMLTARVLPVIRTAQVVAVAGFVVALLLAGLSEGGFQRFYHAYLVSFAFFLSIALGSLFFVMVQHLTRAGWSVAVRRVAEVCAATMPMMAVAFAPIAVSVLVNEGQLYPWAREAPGHHDAASDDHDTKPASAAVVSHPGLEPAEAGHAKPRAADTTIDPHTEDLFIAKKHGYLNPPFFLGRFAIYFAAWVALALWMWRNSTLQDKTGDLIHSQRMQSASAGGIALFAITLTFGAFDLLMSLSPAWYSTIFGVYYFTGSMGAAVAVLILIVSGLQKLGFLTNTVTKEHYHDMGKFLFGFTFFWGYIAFSQYMLIWYANMPETTFWFAQRGASTNAAHFNQWSWISLLLPICHFAIPFAGLLSRHVKRNTKSLAFWAVWVLVMHWIDLWWIVMPEMGPSIHFGLPEIACFFAIAGLFAAMALRLAKMNKLVPVNDPRINASLAFENT